MHLGLLAGTQELSIASSQQPEQPATSDDKCSIEKHIQRMQGLVGGCITEGRKAFSGTPKAKGLREKARLSEVSQASPKVLKKPAALKRPAAADAPRAPKGALPFPGTAKRPPIHFGGSVVYFSPNRFRVLMKKTDRVDTAFHVGAMDPREAWRQVVNLLYECNPELRE